MEHKKFWELSRLDLRALAVIIMMLLTSATAWADKSGYCGDPNVNDGKNVTWSYVESTHTLTISGPGAMADYSGNAPWNSDRNDIQTVVINGGVTSIGKMAFIDCRSLSSVTIPSSVTSIGEAAFNACTSLSSVTIPSSVTSIGNNAFCGCTSLSSVTFPYNVTNIGGSAFVECSSLKKVYVLRDNPPTLGGAAFYHTSTDLKIWVPSAALNTYNINAGWYDYKSKMDGFGGYCGNSLVGKEVIWNLTDEDNDGTEETLTITGTGEMKNFSNSGNAPWYNDRNDIQTVVIEEGVGIIGDRAFANCSNLKTVYVLRYDANSDLKFTKLNNINAFEGTPTDLKIRVPSAGLDTYKAADNWKDYESKIKALQYTTGVDYLDWDDTQKKLVNAKTPEGTDVYILNGTETTLGTAGQTTWYVAKGTLAYTGGLTLTGDTHLILADDATLTVGITEQTISGESRKVGIYAGGDFTVYEQEEGRGKLWVVTNANYSYAIYANAKNITFNGGEVLAKDDGVFSTSISSANITINGGEVTVTSTGVFGITANNVTINGGTVKVKGDYGIGETQNVSITGGTVEVTGGYFGIRAYNDITISGGQVDITGGASGNGISGNVTLCSWTSAGDYFKASSYVGSMTIGTGYYFTYEGHTGEPLTGTVPDLTTIAGKKLVPAQKKVTGGGKYFAFCSDNGNWVLNDPNAQVYVVTGYDLANGLVILTEVTGNEIPEGVPVIIGGASLPTDLWLMGEEKLSDEAASSISGRKPYFFVCDGTTTVADLLKAALGDTADLSDYVLFTLVNDGFRPVIATPTSTPAKGTCVLAIPKMELLNRAQGGSEGTSGARTQIIPIDLGGETDMRPTPGPSLYGGEWYDLQGRRLSGAPTKKGVYIHGDHAVVVQ